MSPKTRLAEKKNNEDVLEKKKNESIAKKKKAAAEKKKAAREKKKMDSVRKKKETSVKRRIEAVKKKRNAAKKKTETETAEKKRKRNSGVDGGSLSNPTKRARNTASPPEQEHQGDNSPAPSAELPSQADVESTRAPSEAKNPLQPPVTSLSISESATNCPSHRLDNHDEEIVSNNRDSHTPEAAIDHTAQRTEAEDIAVNPLRPNEFFFKPKDYRKSCKLQSRCHQYKFMTILGGLDESEKRWFLEHPQFKHLFHMVCTSTRKMMGLWMLLLRTIVTHKSRQAWFAVNGVPIRYSIREHGITSQKRECYVI
ncbi:unnamed protein product [Brassica rapa subsp. trilocularis]